ncbi:MAG: A/G-specific adenine glycosylase [Saprospiraceae bacterium]|nr:A/G-specific adenine glycosylase [Saprospiraceae bacterium]
MISAKSFRSKLYEWAQANPRDYPWMGERDPYKIWISEILLQQTRSEQAKAYYLNFLKTFPTLNALAHAPLDLVLKQWQGLGYYSRARNLHITAQFLVEQNESQFPKEPEVLQKLKGIGPYTAAAIASFAYNFPISVLDGNVIRVFARLLGIPHLPIHQNEKKEWEFILAKYLDVENSSLYNQALMNFGSIHCKPIQPKCSECLYKNNCTAYVTEMIPLFPAKKKKLKLKLRYFHFIYFVNPKNEILIQHRKESDIWKELYQLPLFESARNKTLKTITLDQLTNNAKNKLTNFSLTFLESQIIKLTHQELHCHFYFAQDPRSQFKIKPPFSFVNRENLVNFAFPTVITRFLTKINRNDLC